MRILQGLISEIHDINKYSIYNICSRVYVANETDTLFGQLHILRLSDAFRVFKVILICVGLDNHALRGLVDTHSKDVARIRAFTLRLGVRLDCCSFHEVIRCLHIA